MPVTNEISPFQRFLRLLHRYRNEVNSIYVYAFFNALISLSVPLGIQTIINLIQGGQVSTSWIVIVVLVTLGIMASGFLLIMQHVVSENIQQKIFLNSAFDFAYRIPKFKTESVDKAYIPELVNRFFDTILVQKGVSKIILDYSVAIIQIFLGLLLLMFYHPSFISFGAVLVLIIYFTFKYTFPIGLATSIKESKFKYELVHWLEDLGNSMKTFKLAGTTSLPLDKTNRITTKWIEHRKGHFRILMIQYICLVGFRALIAAGLLIIGGLLVINQQMNIGQFVAAEIIILMILTSIEKLISDSETFFDVLTSLDKLGEITDIPLENHGSIFLEEGDTGLSLQTKNLAFGFPGNRSLSLDGINLSVASGELVGIVGHNGSGKSTLLKIIGGLYQDFSGSLAFNKIPIHNLNKNSLRGIIGDNLDENTLFEGTILENISMGKDKVTLDEIFKFCEVLDLMDFILSQPQGIETEILSEGKTLSNSIKLKIIMARCFAEKPKLILLEDNLGYFEPGLRNRIQNYIFDKERGWTVIAATNNPEYLKKMDRIIILENGKITESGLFSELEKVGKLVGLIN